MFYIIYPFFWLLFWLPLPLLLPFSDFCALILCYVVRYRRKVVRQNLTQSFPEKTPKEIKRMEWRVYRNFAEVMIESVYSIHMSKREMRRRMTFSNEELLHEALSKKQGCFLMSSHYGSFDWLTGAKASIQTDAVYYYIYRRFANKAFDREMRRVRENWGSFGIEMHDLVPMLEKGNQDGVKRIFGMISDQKPSSRHPQYWHWTKFLGQDTPFLTGTEFLARKYDYAVLYVGIEKVGRGRYHARFEKLCDEPTLTADGEITEKYVRLLEKDIQAAPEPWLWTHNRWKFKR